MRPRVCVVLIVGPALLAGCPKITQPTKADALDGITGTESWRRAPENISREWREWYRARVAWRREHRERRIQRVRNVRLADLMDRYPDGPGMEEVQRVLRSQAIRMPRNAGQAVPDPVGPDVPLDGADTGEPTPPPPPRQRGRASRDRGREPPSWIKVPVERLDATGQAIDDEGDRVLDRSLNKKR